MEGEFVATPISNEPEPEPAPATKYAKACSFCRTKKVKCEGGHPCRQCTSHHTECLFPTRNRQKPRRIRSEKMSTRLVRLEALINSSSKTHRADAHGGHGRVAPTEDTSIARTDFCVAALPKDDRSAITIHEVDRLDNATRSESTWVPSNLDSTLDHRQPRSVAGANFDGQGNSTESDHDQMPRVIIDAAYFQSQTATTATTGLKSPSVTKTGSTQALAESPKQLLAEMSNREYFGPRAFLSIASQPGIEWLESKVQYPAMRESLHRFARTVTMLFKQNAGPTPANFPASEPAEDVAWSYVNAFFTKSLDAAFGIVDQYWFYTTLLEHFRIPSPDDEDLSWFALRFTVYAFGCRIALSKNEPYARAAEASMALFGNALSVQSDIMHRHATINGVRALSLMAYFSEGIGSPHMTYTLISNAMRLAIAKGLHCQAPSTWRLSRREILQRNQLFWNIYVLDRQISSRSGLPPAIDDDEISCDTPDISTSISDTSATFTTICVLLGQIQSQAYRRLSSARARRQPTEKIIRAVTELNAKVDSLKHTVKHFIPFDDAIEDIQLPQNMTRCQLMVAYFLYYSVLIDIHSSLLVPWFHFTDSGQFDAFRAQVESSCRTVAETARSIILCTGLIRLKPTTPVLLALYGPFRASIMLFIHILSNPGAATAQSDLVLMGVASGYAHRLNFETGGAFNWPYIGEWAAAASAAVHSARPSDAGFAAQIREPGTAMMDSSNAGVGAQIEAESNTPNPGENQYFQELFDPSFEGDMDLWSTLVPVISSEELDMGIFAT
ncbi:uncharacterized protein A1O9_03593 [Exophiala aquamarina CBS 119918]|uniref:Zn(2)-C6 fungal-type domain-containing protein n=1 Tax=Exophiala aquamarina CBS 119918 TaxID=1182545 RepID=A0A072PQ66_9EURO|nr:uncharacterized protein A1O9_03593 [Exophiala aquamarina CBS 119918]KEF62021.1 hypothetical protein A1O9_03593 [Exophiala aquamarina CBS 119918]